MTKIVGVSAFSHDAAVSILHNGSILFGAHSERYSRVKNDKHLSPALIQEAQLYGKPDVIAFYEKPLLKRMRQVYSGQYNKAFAKEQVEDKIETQYARYFFTHTKT